MFISALCGKVQRLQVSVHFHMCVISLLLFFHIIGALKHTLFHDFLCNLPFIVILTHLLLEATVIQPPEEHNLCITQCVFPPAIVCDMYQGLDGVNISAYIAPSLFHKVKPTAKKNSLHTNAVRRCTAAYQRYHSKCQGLKIQ